MYDATPNHTPAAPSDAPRPSDGRLIDTFARSISYLRVSLTDQCNLRCLYCTPKGLDAKLTSGELLTYEELLRVIRIAVEMGIRKVRLTGGEPLIRRDVDVFLQGLAAIEGLDDIRLTTNGVLLADHLDALRHAGIGKLNISLDTLRPERYREITGAACFDRVWNGIQQAKARGFAPLKINVVALRGVNDDEFVDFARLTLTEPFQVRFIEFMPIGEHTAWERDRYISSEEIRGRLEAIAPLLPVETRSADGPARVFRYAEGTGSIGFISPISDHFCDRCNRLRLTSEGRLRSCLLTDQETDLRSIIRQGGTDETIQAALLETIRQKPKGHGLTDADRGSCHGQMSRIGG